MKKWNVTGSFTTMTLEEVDSKLEELSDKYDKSDCERNKESIALKMDVLSKLTDVLNGICPDLQKKKIGEELSKLDGMNCLNKTAVRELGLAWVYTSKGELLTAA